MSVEKKTTDHNKKTARDLLIHWIPVAAFCSMVIFGGLFLRDFLQYREAEREYHKLSELYRPIEKPEEQSLSERSNGDPKNKRTTEAGQPELPDIPDLNIDFGALKKINPSLACVLYIPALKLCYPVVYSEDNLYELNHTFSGTENAAGTIFYDCLSERAFAGTNTFLFGHNMKNGTMFGSLKNFLRDSSLYKKNPFFYIYTDETVKQYEIVSYYTTREDSETYEDFQGEAGYARYLDYIREQNVLPGERLSSDRIERQQKPLVTLSTCAGTQGSAQRFVVHGIWVAEQPR